MNRNTTIALVTGGNRGLGRATVLALAGQGTDVILTYRSNKEEAAAVVEAVAALGRTAVALRLDTTEFGAFLAFAASVREALRVTWDRETFDFLVNNAGSSVSTPVGRTTVEAFDLLGNVHFKGVVFLTQELLPLLADGGRVINLSTGLTRFFGEGYAVYASFKSAVETYSRYLAQELGGRGISVNAVAPGPVATDFGGGRLRDDEQVRAHLAGQTALGRVGEPEDIGGVIAALLAPGTGWISGQRIEASGGSRL
ncbi:SDR family NAD(P)-dependent oxidoreductase [Streptomyces halstedii]|uniref:SDR family NAD(P)-dependent oxidoreductase n=1 Tax=Streptomyces halstedii TaxID=1944 RepID=UPI0034604C96